VDRRAVGKAAVGAVEKPGMNGASGHVGVSWLCPFRAS
jgi:hypothetical protein